MKRGRIQRKKGYGWKKEREKVNKKGNNRRGKKLKRKNAYKKKREMR